MSNSWDGTTQTLATVAAVQRHQARVHRLFQGEGPGAPRLFLLEKAEQTLGRASGCELQIDSPQISRQHLQISWRDGEYLVRDLDSQNGVYLNEIKVHRATLRDGDALQLGDALLRYYEG